MVSACHKWPRMINSEEYAILRNESAVNQGGVPMYTQEEVQKFRDGTDPNYPNFDYYDYMVRDYPPQMQQTLSVRGGSEKIRYYFLLDKARKLLCGQVEMRSLKNIISDQMWMQPFLIIWIFRLSLAEELKIAII